MSDTPFISSIAALSDRYDALLVDAWGVIHNGVTLFPGVQDAMMAFRKHRGPVLVLTNAPRPSWVIPPQLDHLGLSREAYDGVVTSGDATRAAIEAMVSMPAFRLGPSKDDPLFEDLAIDFCAVEDAGFIICTGLIDDHGETPDDYRELLESAAARKLPMICANPDIVVNWGGRMIWCAGALAQIYEQLGGDVVYGGKPHKPIYDLAFERLASLRGEAIPADRVLAIGDGLGTDIKGANDYGVDAVLITGEGGIHDGASDETSVSARLESAGVHAVATAKALSW